MGIFDFDPDKLNQESDDANNSKMWLNIANSAANNILSAPSASEIMLGQKRAPINVGIDKVADGIKDPWDKQKKTYEAYKAAKEGQALESESDPDSKSNMALKAMLISQGKAKAEDMEGLSRKDLSSLYANPAELEKIKAQAQINFQNEMAKQKAAQGFTASENAKSRQADLDKENLKRTIEQAKKNDPQDRLKNMSGTDKARFDNALMVARSIDEMGSALDQGNNTFSLIGDNNYTEAQRKAAEAYGRMQSGGAINKDEEDRFLAMLPRSTDSKEMQRKKLVSQRDEMMSRLKTLGFSPQEAGYAQRDFSYGDGGAGSKSANAKNEKPKTVIQNGHTYTLNPVTGEYE